jgi:hypothetical protein
MSGDIINVEKVPPTTEEQEAASKMAFCVPLLVFVILLVAVFLHIIGFGL